jgi:HEPN domain-containing protein
LFVFFCHLSLEKLLKKLVVIKTKTHAPFTHELDLLAEKTEINLTQEQIKELKIINTFNIRARYDDIKFSFYKKCTKFYTEKYFNIFLKLYVWLKKQYP